jgi:hypothetical protein
MAGVKVTDLTSTSTAAVDDIMYIVDTSSNTSKQIEVQDIYSGMPQFASGIYTPVVTNETNNSTITIEGGLYSRVGDIVTVTIKLIVILDTGETTTGFNISLPIPTTFTDREELIGNFVAYPSTAGISFSQSNVQADITNTDLMQCSFESDTAADTMAASIVAQYLIL